MLRSRPNLRRAQALLRGRIKGGPHMLRDATGDFDHLTDEELVEKTARDARELGLIAPTEH